MGEGQRTTVKIRLAVAVNEDGEWYAWGAKDYSDDEMRNEVTGQVCDPHAVHFVEAEVPLPVPTTIQGTVQCSTPSPPAS